MTRFGSFLLAGLFLAGAAQAAPPQPPSVAEWIAMTPQQRMALREESRSWNADDRTAFWSRFEDELKGMSPAQRQALADQAAKSKDVDERRHLFGNYLFDSRILLRDHPEFTRLWVLRAVAALQLDKAATGSEAGRILEALPPKDRADPHVQKLLVVLGSKGWLAPAQPVATPASAVQPGADKPAK